MKTNPLKMKHLSQKQDHLLSNLKILKTKRNKSKTKKKMSKQKKSRKKTSKKKMSKKKMSIKKTMKTMSKGMTETTTERGDKEERRQ